MKNNFNIGKYKNVILPIVFLGSSIFIFLQVFLPSFLSLDSLRKEVTSEEDKVSEYNKSISTLESLDKNDLENDLITASGALPTEKNIQAVYLALTNAASVSNTSLSGFSVIAGEIYDKEGKKKELKGIPSLKVSVDFINLNEKGFINFSEALREQSPISKVTSVNISKGQAEVDIDFYYKPLDLPTINKEIILPVTQDEKKILDSFRSR